MGDHFHDIDFRLYVFEIVGIQEYFFINDFYGNRLPSLYLFS